MRYTYPVLKNIFDPGCELTLVQYSVKDEEHLFKLIKDECGLSLNQYYMIFSMPSINNPELTLYITEHISESIGDGTDFHSLNEFLYSVWSTIQIWNMLSYMLHIPADIQNMTKLVCDKYMPLIFALNYTDVSAWVNADLIEAVNNMVPNEYKNCLNIWDVVDDVLLMVYYNDWTDGLDDS